MGKPFNKELELIKDTIIWADGLDSSQLSYFFNTLSDLPLLAVGSGGSFSACHYAALLYEKNGKIAKAITPFDYIYSQDLICNSKSLFISASGKNNDIQISLKRALSFNAPIVANLSMKTMNPLADILKNSEHNISINFELPTGKDGFLATNSLISFFCILYKSFNQNKRLDGLDIPHEWLIELNEFSKLILDRFNFTVLYGGWGLPVAYDIESKFTEAALGAVQLSDYRNFGHGRHHWLDKHKNTSCIVALITPREKKIAEKTLSLIPTHIPRVIIESSLSDSKASIDLLIKSFHLSNMLGEIRKIDPGRPGVPGFGRKLYNLRYSSLLKDISPKYNDEIFQIIRKAHVQSLEELSETEQKKWEQAHRDFSTKLKNKSFTGLVLDYDGTICSNDTRYNDILNERIRVFLENLLNNNIPIGIVTGRGGSIKTLLRNSISKKHWGNVYIGYYNGAEMGELNDDSVPNQLLPPDNSLKILHENFHKEYIVNQKEFEKIELRSFQLTIRAKNKKAFDLANSAFHSMIFQHKLDNVCILQSSHSLDIIVRPNVSKLNLVNTYFDVDNCLCIGDKGVIPGNDFELLSCTYSLSVDEVSYNPKTCWNLAPKGIKNIDAMFYYIDRIVVNTNHFNIKLGK